MKRMMALVGALLAGAMLWASPRKVLVTYYSATGSTKAVAEKIAEETGADLFAIEPRTAYSSRDLDWRNRRSRVVREHDDPDLRSEALKIVTPRDFASYDVVFIGYPIWWQDASWVVDGFVKGNDFTGKTVIPFCTSLASPIGESGGHLARMAKGGDWLQGARFTRSTGLSEIRQWIDTLPLD